MIFQRAEFIALSTVDSTNLEAKRQIDESPNRVLIISADEQSQGRGRLDRVWVSEPGNLYLSIVLPVTWKQEQSSTLPLVVGLSIAKTLENIGVSNISLKWPNDVLIDEKKVAGILVEQYKNHVIIGVGINISNTPDNVRFPATCLNASPSLNEIPCQARDDGFEVRDDGLWRDNVMQTLLDQIENELMDWVRDGFNDIKAQYLEYAYKLGQNLTVNNKVGVFQSIDDLGRILLKAEDGSVVAVSIAE